jgi:putative ABC transport system permease protein
VFGFRWFYAVRSAVLSLLGRRRFDAQLDADVTFHLEEATAELIRAGMTPAQARRTALREFGNPVDVMEDVRDMSLAIWSERLVQDLRYGVRGFRRTPVFALTALLSVSLAVGAATAIFSIYNAVMLRPLPVREPEAIFQIVHRGESGSAESSTYGLYEHFKQNARTLQGILQVNPASSTGVLIDGQAEAVVSQVVTGDYFSLLGVTAALGSLIGPADEHGAPPNRVAVLGHDYWMRRFGGDPGVLGRVMTVDNTPHTIIGVTEPGFFGMQPGRRFDITLPLDGTDDRDFWKSRALIVRLAPGVSRETARADLNVGLQRYLDDVKTVNPRARAQYFKSVDLVPASGGLSEFRDRYGKPVQALLGIVCALVVLGSVNLAGVFLARAAARRRDLSVCLALGARRTRLVRQLLSETLVVALTGGGLGILAAWWSVEALLGFLPGAGTTMHLEVPLDRNVLIFSLLMTLLTGVAVGLAPAWLARGLDIRSMLSAGDRTVAASGTAFKGLMVVQLAISTMLMVSALLFATTLANLRMVPLGFDATGVLTLAVDAGATDLEGEPLAEVQRQVLAKLQALPGVQRASFATIPPLSGNEDGKPVAIPGVTLAPGDSVLQVNTVGPDFFETFGVQIMRGRGIVASDQRTSPQVAVISESMARHYFPGVDPIGRRMDVGRGRTGGQIEIVGIAADARYRDVRTAPVRMVYVPASQRDPEPETVFAIRTAGDPAAWAQSARHEVQSVLPSILTTAVEPMAAQRDAQLVNERLLAIVSSCFADLALLIAGLGIYGVVSYTVTQRTRELGLRMALGAPRTRVVMLVVRGTLSLVILAVAIGVSGSLMTSSFLSSLLYGVQPVEPWVYAATGALLLGIAVLGTLAPTLRAMRIDPVETLRWE